MNSVDFVESCGPGLMDGPAKPHVKYSFSGKKLKGEDTCFVKEREWVGDVHGDGNFWGVFILCDGHCGVDAAAHVAQNLWPALRLRLPTCPPPSRKDHESASWCLIVQKAIVKAFADMDAFVTKKCDMPGCTVTLALVCDWTLTIANVGDSDALLDTLTDFREATMTHRLDSSEAERQRLRDAGVELGRLTKCLEGSSGSEEKGVGPIRSWPGGLANSRAIGDKHGGNSILPVPHIRQYLLPSHGGRVILASDGLWDIMAHQYCVRICRRANIDTAADRLLTSAVYQNGWAFHDDMTIVVFEVTEAGREDFYSLAKRTRKLTGMKKRLQRAFSCSFPSKSQLKQEVSQDQVQVIGDVDGLDIKQDMDEDALGLQGRLCTADSASELRVRAGLARSCLLKAASDTCGIEKRYSHDSDELMPRRSLDA